MNAFSHVPPGFRFHPTDEELVDYYLRKKLAARKIDLDVIKEIDLYKIEPWDLQEKCRIGTEEEKEWYFFSHKDKKYPTGTRTNRATTAGFWKATGRDKPIYSKRNLVGMRKTLVYYKGRAPNGQKSDWIIHEYRLQTDINGNPQEEGWVVCRIFMKRMAMVQRNYQGPTCWNEDRIILNNNIIPDLESPENNNNSNLQPHNYNVNNSCSFKKETDQLCLNPLNFHDQHHALAQLGSYVSIPENNITSLLHLQNPSYPLVAQEEAILQPDNLYHLLQQQQQHPPKNTMVNSRLSSSSRNIDDNITDWRLLDKFVASQLSQDDEIIDGRRNLPNNISVVDDVFQVNDDHQLGRTLSDLASTSASTFQIDLWK